MLKSELLRQRALGKLPSVVFAVVFVFIFLFFVIALSAQKKDQAPAAPAPAEYKIPPEAAAKANPVKATPESLAKGKKMYGYDCAMCHGDKGDGKGDMASDIKNVTDFTKADALKGRTDGELFYEIRNGKGDMPPEGDRAKDEEVWNMVNYCRSLAKK